MTAATDTIAGTTTTSGEGRRRFGIRFTLSGLMAVPVVVVVLVSAMNSDINLLFLLGSIAIAAGVMNLLLVRAGTAGVKCRRVLPAAATVGRPVDVVIEVRNEARFWSAYALSVEDRVRAEVRAGAPVGFVAHLRAGRKADCVYRLVPAGRGELVFRDIVVRSRFPFGLLQRKLTAEAPGKLLVWPARGRLAPELIDRGRRLTDERMRRAVRRDDGEEFRSLRDWRTGDNPRMIHWRSTARRGKPVVREMETRVGGRIVVVLDAGRPGAPVAVTPDGDAAEALASLSKRSRSGRGSPATVEPPDPDHPDVRRRERAVAFVATVVEDALEHGTEVGLAAWDGRDWIVHPPAGGIGQRNRLLDALALIPDHDGRGAGEALRTLPPEDVAGGLLLVVAPAADRLPPDVPEPLQRAAAEVTMLAAGTPGFDRLWRPHAEDLPWLADPDEPDTPPPSPSPVGRAATSDPGPQKSPPTPRAGPGPGPQPVVSDPTPAVVDGAGGRP